MKKRRAKKKKSAKRTVSRKTVSRKTVKRPTLRQFHENVLARALRQQEDTKKDIDAIRRMLTRIAHTQDVIVAVLQPIVTDLHRRPLQISEFNHAAFQELVDKAVRETPELFDD